jgi:hypothetical protein
MPELWVFCESFFMVIPEQHDVRWRCVLAAVDQDGRAITN